jgi:hypothetical protein
MTGGIVRAYIDGELAQEMQFPYSIARSGARWLSRS